MCLQCRNFVVVAFFVFPCFNGRLVGYSRNLALIQCLSSTFCISLSLLLSNNNPFAHHRTNDVNHLLFRRKICLYFYEIDALKNPCHSRTLSLSLTLYLVLLVVLLLLQFSFYCECEFTYINLFAKSIWLQFQYE